MSVRVTHRRSWNTRAHDASMCMNTSCQVHSGRGHARSRLRNASEHAYPRCTHRHARTARTAATKQNYPCADHAQPHCMRRHVRVACRCRCLCPRPCVCVLRVCVDAGRDSRADARTQALANRHIAGTRSQADTCSRKQTLTSGHSRATAMP